MRRTEGLSHGQPPCKRRHPLCRDAVEKLLLHCHHDKLCCIFATALRKRISTACTSTFAMNLRAATSPWRGKQAKHNHNITRNAYGCAFDLLKRLMHVCLPAQHVREGSSSNSWDSIPNPISTLRTPIHLVDVWEELVRRFGLVVVPRIGVLITQVSGDPQQALRRHILLTLFPQYSSSTGMPLVAKSYAKNAPTTAAQIQPALASAKPARQIVYPP